LFFDALTTEVIADGKHLQGELLKLAYKVKGPDRLALVTDCMRALDMPDGEYLFGPLDGGERVRRGGGGRARRGGGGVGAGGAGVRRDGARSRGADVPSADGRSASGGRADGESDAGAGAGIGERDRQYRGGQARRSSRARPRAGSAARLHRG